MDKLVSYAVPDIDHPFPMVTAGLLQYDKDCRDDAQLERWRYYQPGLSYDGDIGEGPDSWGV